MICLEDEDGHSDDATAVGDDENCVHMTVSDLSTILLSTMWMRTRRDVTKARTKGRSVANVHSFAAFVFHLGRGASRTLSKHDLRSLCFDGVDGHDPLFDLCHVRDGNTVREVSTLFALRVPGLLYSRLHHLRKQSSLMSNPAPASQPNNVPPR